MRHAYSEDPAAHGGLHAGGDRAEGCHVLFHLGNLMGFHGRRRRRHRISFRRTRKDTPRVVTHGNQPEIQGIQGNQPEKPALMNPAFPSDAKKLFCDTFVTAQRTR